MSRTLWLLGVMWVALGLCAPTARAEVTGFLVTTDRTIDASSLQSIVRDVTAHKPARHLIAKEETQS